MQGIHNTADQAFIDGAAARMKTWLSERRTVARSAREQFSQSPVFAAIRAKLLESTEPLELDSVAADVYPEDILKEARWSFMTLEEFRAFVDVFDDAGLPGADSTPLQRVTTSNHFECISYQSFGLYVTVMLGGRGCAATYVRNKAAQAEWEKELHQLCNTDPVVKGDTRSQEVYAAFAGAAAPECQGTLAQ